MKKYVGYIVAAASLLFTALITLFARNFGTLLDGFYPYFSRVMQGILARIASIAPFVWWQLIVVAMGILLVVSFVFLFIRKRSFVRWLGWVLAVACLLWTAHTTVHGLNFYTSSLSERMHMENGDISAADLKAAMTYFRDRANELALSLPRDAEGNLIYDDFDTLAEKAGAGFEKLKSEGYSVFPGSTLPVKKLGWARLYSAMGICGVTMAVTGEAAVNADIPNMSLPFVMCHEMSHRMAIATEDDANFAAFLACIANDDPQFQYSAYYSAYTYCYNELGGSAASSVHAGVNEQFGHDLYVYNHYFEVKKNDTVTNVATSVNDTYIQVSGDAQGVKSYGQVATQLTNWYLQQVASHPQTSFDPTDRDYINGILGEEHAG